MLVISVGALVGTGVNLEAMTKGVNGSVSESSCFISADGLRPERAEIRTDVSSDGMMARVERIMFSWEWGIRRSVEYRVTSDE